MAAIFFFIEILKSTPEMFNYIKPLACKISVNSCIYINWYLLCLASVLLTNQFWVGICISSRKIPLLPIPVPVNTFVLYFFIFFILNHLKFAYMSTCNYLPAGLPYRRNHHTAFRLAFGQFDTLIKLELKIQLVFWVSLILSFNYLNCIERFVVQIFNYFTNYIWTRNAFKEKMKIVCLLAMIWIKSPLCHRSFSIC